MIVFFDSSTSDRFAKALNNLQLMGFIGAAKGKGDCVEMLL